MLISSRYPTCWWLYIPLSFLGIFKLFCGLYVISCFILIQTKWVYSQKCVNYFFNKVAVRVITIPAATIRTIAFFSQSHSFSFNTEYYHDVAFIPTRRFFSSSSSTVSLSTTESAQEDLPQGVEPTAVSPTEDKSSPSDQTNDSDGPDVPSVDTPSPPPSPGTTPPSPASQGLRLFNWSGSSSSMEKSKSPKSTSGLAALQQFQFRRESFSSSPKTHNPCKDTSSLCPSSTDGNPEDNPPDSPPSQDSAYFSQSQPDHTTCHKEEVPTHSLPCFDQNDATSVCSYKSPLYL